MPVPDAPGTGEGADTATAVPPLGARPGGGEKVAGGPPAGDREAHAGAPGHGAGDSLFRNAYALMLSTGVSAALGLGFWLVAARHYTQEAVGQGSAAIAAMRLLSSLTATTMIGAVVRYVPRAGRGTGPLVRRAYAFSSLVVCLASVAFLFTLDLWGPSYAPLGGLAAGAVFTASCVGWALLTLQDGVLTGLRRAVWVPVGNTVFSVGKLLLLVVFAGALPVLGIFVSWAVAIALSVLPLGWMVFRRLIPRQAAADHDREPPSLRDIGRFLAGDSVGSLFSLAMINLLPVMVAVSFDAAHNGFFYIAYTVGGTMEFMAINMASSLTAHASHSPKTLAAGVRGALRRMAMLLVPVVVVLVVFAPQILAPFGEDYAAHGTTVLRLLAAAALPRVAVELYIGVLRVQGRTGVLALLQAAMCVLVLGSAALLLGPAGIAGAGWAVLLSMTAMALVCVPGLRAVLAGGRPPRPGLRVRAARARARVGEEWAVTVLWLFLGFGAGLFWTPLAHRPDAGHVDWPWALPALSLAGLSLLLVVQVAAAALPAPQPGLLGGGLLATFAALHTAPWSGLRTAAGQLLCLCAVFVILRLVRLPGVARWAVLLLLLAGGRAVREQLDALLFPLQLSLLCVVPALAALRGHRRRHRRIE
jgi:O-antigen/teichoic acid export membrane protein